jgi:hypothetical protein
MPCPALQNRLPRFNSGRGLQHLAKSTKGHVNVKSTERPLVRAPLSRPPRRMAKRIERTGGPQAAKRGRCLAIFQCDSLTVSM